MKSIFHDWQAKRITSVLHEKKGGYANSMASMRGTGRKCESEGVRMYSGVTATGFDSRGSSPAITSVTSDRGNIECDQVIIGAGPWVRDFWTMLELPRTISIRGADGV